MAEEEMNIVQAYKKFIGQLIIIISGMSESGRSELAKNISEDFEMKIIQQNDYYIKNYSKEIELPNGVKTINWFNDDAYDWVKLNEDVTKNKTHGIIIVGICFPNNKLKFEVDYHIQLSIKKSVLLDRMEKLLEKNKDKYPEKYEEMNSGKLKLIFNQLSYPYFLNSAQVSTINKFINATEMSNEQIYDIIFDYLIQDIEKKVYNIPKKTINKILYEKKKQKKYKIDENKEDDEADDEEEDYEEDEDKDEEDEDKDEEKDTSSLIETTDSLETTISDKNNNESSIDIKQKDINLDNNKFITNVDTYNYGLKGDFLY